MKTLWKLYRCLTATENPEQIIQIFLCDCLVHRHTKLKLVSKVIQIITYNKHKKMVNVTIHTLLFKCILLNHIQYRLSQKSTFLLNFAVKKNPKFGIRLIWSFLKLFCIHFHQSILWDWSPLMQLCRQSIVDLLHFWSEKMDENFYYFGINQLEKNTQIWLVLSHTIIFVKTLSSIKKYHLVTRKLWFYLFTLKNWKSLFSKN